MTPTRNCHLASIIDGRMTPTLNRCLASLLSHRVVSTRNLRLAWMVVAALPLLAGAGCNNAPCGEVVQLSPESNAKGELMVAVSNAPGADSSLRMNIGGTFFTASPTNPGTDPTTYQFTGLPSGTFQNVAWEMSGCEDESVAIDGPTSVTVQ